ncbi:MAG TPA: histidine kinase [Candidatus Merdibacter merdigallinarum]|nr:histidine kinase [Candidatus Merdibacter merdigallinarum]
MTLDSFLILLSDTAWKLVPVVLVVLLIYVITLLRHAIELAKQTKQTMHTVQDDLKKLDKPLQTVNELSETIDLVHEASRNAVRSVLVTIIENASSIKDWILSKKRTDEESSEQVQEVDSDGR